MKLMVLTVLTVSLMSSPGCSKKGGNVADPCETSIGAAIDAMLGARKEGAPPQMIEISNKLRTVMISRCKADSWPAEALDCYRAATDQPGIRKCRERLPPEKAQRLQGEILKVMSGAGRPGGFRGGQGGPPPGMGGPHGGMGPPAGGPPGAGGPPAGDPPASAGSTTPE